MPEDEKLMGDEEFDREVALAAAGKWAELGLDAPDQPLPGRWEPESINDWIKEPDA